MEMLPRLRMAISSGEWPSAAESGHHQRRVAITAGPLSAEVQRPPAPTRPSHARTRRWVPLPGRTLFGFLLSWLVAPWL